MYGTKHGFSLIEILLVVMLIGITTTIFIPNIMQLLPGHKRSSFVSDLNNLLGIAWQNGLKTGKAHRLYFDLEKRIIRVEIETEKQKAGESVFKQVPAQVIATSLILPSVLQLKQFYIEGEEKLQKAGVKTEAIWFYITSEGLTQNVIINGRDTTQKDAEGDALPFGLVINPFTAQFKEYDEFQKP